MVSISQDLGESTGVASTGNRPRYIFHITTLLDWADAKKFGDYRLSSIGRALQEGGFISAGTEAQVEGVANAMFRGARGLALLMIDTKRVAAEILWEAPQVNNPIARKIVGEVHFDSPTNIEEFPHIFGPLNLDAVVDVLPLDPGPGGRFSFPRHLMDPMYR